MKTFKHLSVVLALLLVASLAVVSFAVNAADDTITVSNADEFRAAMAAGNANKNIVLTQDIDLGEDGNTTMNAAYKGSFDGQGHTVTGITSTLFKQFGGTFKNVTLDGNIETNERWPATICYEANQDNSVIENVVSTVDITSTCGNVNAGGLVGYTKFNFTMKNCEYAGTFHLTWNSSNAGYGGLVGWTNTANSKVVIEDSAFTGTLILDTASAGGMYLGGIIGHAGSGTTTGIAITNCVNSGTIKVNGTTNTNIWVGGIAGEFNGCNLHVIENCVNYGEFNMPTAIVNAGMVGLIADEAAIGTLVKNSVSFNDNGEYATLQDIRGVTAEGSYLAQDIEKVGEPVELKGVMCQQYNFGYLEVDTHKMVDLSVKFEPGTITEQADGSFTVATDSYSAFLSVRYGASAGTQDYRFIIVSDYDLLAANPNLKLTLTFAKSNRTVKTLVKSVLSELKVYASATAAGKVYSAAQGCVFTGIVVTGVPTSSWDSVSITMTDTTDAVVCHGQVTTDELYADKLDALSGMLTNFDGMTEDDFILGHYDSTIKNLQTVSATVVANKGVDGSSALAACRTEWYQSGPDNNMEVKWQLDEPGVIGDNRYLVVWMDLATNNLDFRKACFGLLTNGGWYNPYRADDKEAGCKFYYKADGSDQWVEKTMGADGCFGAGDNCSVAGYKGYFAFPLSDMYSGTKVLDETSEITGIYFYMSILAQEMANKPVYVDNVQLVADYTTVK